jgi:hypothetical protein
LKANPKDDLGLRPTITAFNAIPDISARFMHPLPTFSDRPIETSAEREKAGVGRRRGLRRVRSHDKAQNECRLSNSGRCHDDAASGWRKSHEAQPTLDRYKFLVAFPMKMMNYLD